MYVRKGRGRSLRSVGTGQLRKDQWACRDVLVLDAVLSCVHCWNARPGLAGHSVIHIDPFFCTLSSLLPFCLPLSLPPLFLLSPYSLPDTSLLSSQRMGRSTGQKSSSLAACTTSGLLSSLSSPPHPRSSVTRCTPFEWCRRGSLNSSRSH